MPENHFRCANFNSCGSLDRVAPRRKTQERGYLGSRAHNLQCGLHEACAFCCSARQSCVMATDQESNSLDDFDIEQVINWEEHNYASKNLDVQHLPDLDLPADLPVSCTASVLPQGHGTQPQASHGRTMILGNHVINDHQRPQRDQNITRPLSQTSNAVLNPVFPRDAGYMISDIRQELAQTRTVQDGPRELQPTFPSENFDLPSIRHQRALPASASQVLNFMPSHEQHLNTQRVVNTPQLITRHPSLHNGMQTFSSTAIANEPLNHNIDNEEGADSSIDQLIEDIVDRDMPQGVGDTVVFSTHDVALGNQQIHHVIAQSAPHGATNLTSSNANQMAAMARNSSSIGAGTGSPLPVSGGNIAHAHSPLSQNPASPIIAKAPSPQMPQFKTGSMRSGRGNTKPTITHQQQPHSPQNLAMGVAHSPRSAPQRSPQNVPQRSPQQPSAHSPTSGNPISQNMPSPMSINSQVIGMQHSPVASPMNMPSPQSQRTNRQSSPGSIGSPVNPTVQQDFVKSPGLTQTYMTQVNQAKVSAPKVGNVQNTGNTRTLSSITSTGNPTGNVVPQQPGSNIQNSGNNAWSPNQFMPTQIRQNSNIPQTNVSTSMGAPPTQTHGNVSMKTNTSVAQPTATSTVGQPVSTFDTATVLRGLTALKGSNVIPFQLKQGSNQQLQAVKLPNNAASIDLLKQAMLVKSGQGSNVGQTAGKPMKINTSQGQVICYILPKPVGSNSQSGASTQGQQVKMVVLNSNNVTSSNDNIKTVSALSSGNTVLVSSVNTTGIKTSLSTSTKVSAQPNISFSSTMLQSPMEGITSVVKAVGKNSSNTNTAQNISNPKQSNAVVGSQPSSSHRANPHNPTTQSVDTTRITFVNESTCIDHLVSAPGLGHSIASVITTHPLTSTISTTATKTTPAPSSSTLVVPVDSDDSDTPLAVLAETLRKNGEEKKKKKKRKAEKRKKKEKGDKPLPAFQIFFKETQAAIRQQNPSIDFDNVTKIVTQMWDNLPEDQKKVYYTKQDKAKKDHEKSLEKLKQEPSPKLRKLETSTALPLSSPKSSAPPTISSTTTSLTKESLTKESTKQESITLKIPKAVLNKPEITNKVAKNIVTSKAPVPGSTTYSPAKKKTKVAINPITQRICIREGCNMPARTTKERGTQYCSNECIVAHCRIVFQSWVTKRKDETIQVS